MNTHGLLCLCQHLALTPIPLKPWLREALCLLMPATSSGARLGHNSSQMVTSLVKSSVKRVVTRSVKTVVKWVKCSTNYARAAGIASDRWLWDACGEKGRKGEK